jgi:hypothetical protein
MFVRIDEVIRTTWIENFENESSKGNLRAKQVRNKAAIPSSCHEWEWNFTRNLCRRFIAKSSSEALSLEDMKMSLRNKIKLLSTSA